MGIHEWMYESEVVTDVRYIVPQADKKLTLTNRKKEVELGFDVVAGLKEAHRCLNCDIQTVFTHETCIECDACIDICPMDCLTITNNGEEPDLRQRLRAPTSHEDQDLYVSETLKSSRVMVKDEDVCLHCGLCAERCPTGAWDMQKFLLTTAKASPKSYDKAETSSAMDVA